MDLIQMSKEAPMNQETIDMNGECGLHTRSRSSSMTSISISPSKGSASKTAKRKSSSLPTETVEYLKAWMMSPEHIAHPYPTDQEKLKIMADTNIELKQLTNWFVNNRKRYWKPRVEARLREQQPQTGVASEPSLILPDTSVDEKPAQASEVVLMSETPIVNMNESRQTSGTAHTITAFSSPARTVSDQSSSSDSSSVISSSDFEDFSDEVTTEYEGGWIYKTETVDVHILRPVSSCGPPSLGDVSILSNIPLERILVTFPNRSLTYRVSEEVADDPKKVQRRRDAEVVRIKKYHLGLYLSSNDVQVTSPKRKRDEPVSTDGSISPRPKYRRVSVDLWKQACQTAANGYDATLPSLEEAAQLFGYVGLP